MARHHQLAEGLSSCIRAAASAIAREAPPLSVGVIGETRAARILAQAAWDPKGERMRG